MEYLSLARKAVPYLAAFVAGMVLVNWIDTARINNLKADVKKIAAELTQAKTDLSACQDANDTNQKTIGTLKSEIDRSAAQCTARLRGKERTLASLQRIDAMRPSGGSHEKADKTAAGSTADPVLGELNRMWSTAADSQNRVAAAPGTDDAGNPQVLPRELDGSRRRLYCLDFTNAVDLIKNLILMQGYASELEMIIEPVKEQE